MTMVGTQIKSMKFWSESDEDNDNEENAIEVSPKCEEGATSLERCAYCIQQVLNYLIQNPDASNREILTFYVNALFKLKLLDESATQEKCQEEIEAAIAKEQFKSREALINHILRTQCHVDGEISHFSPTMKLEDFLNLIPKLPEQAESKEVKSADLVAVQVTVAEHPGKVAQDIMSKLHRIPKKETSRQAIIAHLQSLLKNPALQNLIEKEDKSLITRISKPKDGPFEDLLTLIAVVQGALSPEIDAYKKSQKTSAPKTESNRSTGAPAAESKRAFSTPLPAASSRCTAMIDTSGLADALALLEDFQSQYVEMQQTLTDLTSQLGIFRAAAAAESKSSTAEQKRQQGNSSMSAGMGLGGGSESKETVQEQELPSVEEILKNIFNDVTEGKSDFVSYKNLNGVHKVLGVNPYKDFELSPRFKWVNFLIKHGDVKFNKGIARTTMGWKLPALIISVTDLEKLVTALYSLSEQTFVGEHKNYLAKQACKLMIHVSRDSALTNGSVSSPGPG